MFPLPKSRALLLCALCASVVNLHAAETGAVTGRVFNPASDEYVRDAQIRADASGETVFTGPGGFYLLSGLPAGNTSLTLSYTGLPDSSRTVTITAGATATLDFDLPAARPTATAKTSSKDSPDKPASPAADPDVLQLEEFVVTGQSEGQGKMTMRERAMMEVGHNISSSLFGDDPEGNVGEFLRNVPGVFVNTTNGEITDVSIGGLSSEYTNISIDGQTTSVADIYNDKRSTTFSVISLNSMESIEVLRTVSADADANAPAGTINLRSKSAFDRRGTHGAVRAVLNAHSNALSFHKSLGPDDSRGALKIRPGFLAEFSCAPSPNFGIILNVSESNLYSMTNRLAFNHDYNVGKNGDTRPALPASLEFANKPRISERSAISLRADWRPTQHLVLGASLGYNYANTFLRTYQITFDTGLGDNRANASYIKGDNPMLAFTTLSPGAQLQVSAPAAVTVSTYLTPKLMLEYNSRSLSLDASVAYATSKSRNDAYGEKGSGYTVGTRYTPVKFYASHSGFNASDWSVSQLSGGDISGGSIYGKPGNIYIRDDRERTADVLTAQLNANFISRWPYPINWKAGLKSREEQRTFETPYYLNKVQYIGSDDYSAFKSHYTYDFGKFGASITTLSGGDIWLPDMGAFGRIYSDQPELFNHVAANANDYYHSNVLYSLNFKERIDSAYIMGTTSFLKKKLNLRAGLRFEATHTSILEPTRRPDDEVIAAGYSLSANKIATTIDGVKYQFLSLPRTNRADDYADFFPSASAKYTFRKNLVAQLGFSTAIRRPTFNDLIGVNTFDDAESIINAPNKDLQPEHSRSLALRLAWYPKGAGAISAAFYQNYVKNMIQTDDVSTSDWDAVHGTDLSGEGYSSWLVRSRYNSGSPITVRSFELGWRHHLGFLLKPLRTTSLRLNYTRTFSTSVVAGRVPHIINAGLDWNWRNFNLYANANWISTFPLTSTGQTIRGERTQVDIGGDWRFARRWHLTFRIRNLTDAPYLWMKKVPPQNRKIIYTKDYVGTAYTLSLKYSI